MDHLPSKPDKKELRDCAMDIANLVSFVKPYEGKIYRNGSYFYKRFYDEREWRYVPDLSETESVAIRLSKAEFVN